MLALRDHDVQDYIDAILTFGLHYTVDTVLKLFLPANNTRIRDEIENCPATESLSFRLEGMGAIRVRNRILETWKAKLDAEGNADYALTYIRHRITIHFWIRGPKPSNLQGHLTNTMKST